MDRRCPLCTYMYWWGNCPLPLLCHLPCVFILISQLPLPVVYRDSFCVNSYLSWCFINIISSQLHVAASSLAPGPLLPVIKLWGWHWGEGLGSRVDSSRANAGMLVLVLDFNNNIANYQLLRWRLPVSLIIIHKIQTIAMAKISVLDHHKDFLST